MRTPTVIETTRRPEPVEHDTFIDDLTRPATVPAGSPAGSQQRRR